eukprot:jgi/Chlat1/8154/Chrsp76S07603
MSRLTASFAPAAALAALALLITAWAQRRRQRRHRVCSTEEEAAQGRHGEETAESRKQSDKRREQHAKLVRGVIFDFQTLVQHGQPITGVSWLFERLRHSRLKVGVLVCGSAREAAASLRMLDELSLRPFAEAAVAIVRDSQSSDGTAVQHTRTAAVDELRGRWALDREHVAFITDARGISGFPTVQVQPAAGTSSTPSTDTAAFVTVPAVGAVLMAVARMNKQRLGGNVTVVGYVMKESREQDFLKRYVLPLLPEDNTSFAPVDPEYPVAQQGPFDVLLHKATDEIIVNYVGGKPEYAFSDRMNALEREVKALGMYVPVVDPFECLRTTMDRLLLGGCLQRLNSKPLATPVKVRPPHSAHLDSMDFEYVKARVRQASLSLPVFVKPGEACGTAASHLMAVVTREEGFEGLPVRTPAIVQECIAHSGVVHKVYVMGEAIWVCERGSMDFIASTKGTDTPAAIVFDSLKALPDSLSANLDGKELKSTRIVDPAWRNKGKEGTADRLDTSGHKKHAGVNVESIVAAASWLQEALCLTFFGFDVVVQEGSGDHVIVDVNYLPSFKEVPHAEREMRLALRQKHLIARGHHTQNGETQ